MLSWPFPAAPAPRCGRYAPQLSAEEAEAAMSVLDANKDGGIDFSEWVQWWVSAGRPPAAVMAAQEAAERGGT